MTNNNVQARLREIECDLNDLCDSISPDIRAVNWVWAIIRKIQQVQELTGSTFNVAPLRADILELLDQHFPKA